MHFSTRRIDDTKRMADSGSRRPVETLLLVIKRHNHIRMQVGFSESPALCLSSRNFFDYSKHSCILEANLVAACLGQSAWDGSMSKLCSIGAAFPAML